MSDVQVRPRLVWAGTFSVVVGMVLAGAGLVVNVPVLWIIGAVAIVAGGIVGWRNGIMYDIHASEPVQHAEQNMVSGQAFSGDSPEDSIEDPRAREIAVVTTRDARTARLESTALVEPLPLRRTAATALLGLASWLYLSQFVLEFPMSSLGQNAALRETTFAAVLALCGVFLRQVGPSRFVGGVASLCGIALVVFSVTLPHGTAGAQWNELLSGLAIAIVSVATWV